mmetsp:Transcript_20108/g.58816  ORF Transcript_20108/g.58816 Transcript_20108/m.58816 type:complete len:224 (+) Transcript_20108:2066-2737(+)
MFDLLHLRAQRVSRFKVLCLSKTHLVVFERYEFPLPFQLLLACPLLVLPRVSPSAVDGLELKAVPYCSALELGKDALQGVCRARGSFRGRQRRLYRGNFACGNRCHSLMGILAGGFRLRSGRLGFRGGCDRLRRLHRLRDDGEGDLLLAVGFFCDNRRLVVLLLLCRLLFLRLHHYHLVLVFTLDLRRSHWSKRHQRWVEDSLRRWQRLFSRCLRSPGLYQIL